MMGTHVDERSPTLNNETSAAKRILSTLASVEYLGAPPDLSMRLLAKVKDEKSSADDIAQLIMCSPPISASLLKLCNSAFYGRGQSTDSVSRAVVHLGLKTVVQFVYATDMMGVFRGAQASPAFNESMFWKSSLAAALLAQEIAVTQRIVETEPVFLAALLRDMGVLIMRQYFPDLFVDALVKTRGARMDFNEACIAVCGIDHRSLAFLLALRWNLPSTITAIFQPPSLGHERYDAVLINRNIVLFSDYILRVKNLYAWNEYGLPDPAVGALFYLPANMIDGMLRNIVAEVNEFHAHI